jgi:hypothetical protein
LWNRRDWKKEGKKLKRDDEACCRPRKMEGVRRGPPNAVRHHGEETEEEYKVDSDIGIWNEIAVP